MAWVSSWGFTKTCMGWLSMQSGDVVTKSQHNLVVTMHACYNRNTTIVRVVGVPQGHETCNTSAWCSVQRTERNEGSFKAKRAACNISSASDVKDTVLPGRIEGPLVSFQPVQWVLLQPIHSPQFSLKQKKYSEYLMAPVILPGWFWAEFG